MVSYEAPLSVQAVLKNLPSSPGVYRMYGPDEELLYIGKAKNLKNRVRSYFQKNMAQHTPKTRVMVRQVVRLDYIVTDTEVEALILEASLIKIHQPRYNILLKDDKKFPWVGISDEPYPRLFITRMPERRGKTKYFGPYTNSGDLYATLQVIRKHFQLRQRRKPLFKERPCMNYYIGTCLGPCQNLVTPEDYAKVIHQVELFLKGHSEELLKILEKEMQGASEALNFERAAKLRDRYQAVANLYSQQKIVSDDTKISQDVIAMASDEIRCSVTVLTVRKGKLIGSRNYELLRVLEESETEIFQAFLYQYYQDFLPADLPEEILLQYELEEAALFTQWLSVRRGKKFKLTQPQQGLKKSLLAMALKNAEESLTLNKQTEAERLQRDPARGLLELQERLGLPDYPERMECYDISHVQGKYTVASMVVFTDGKPDKQAYRRFKIQSAEGKPDDFKSMAEVIRRRFTHSGSEDGWDDPDLVIIDGGKGQLHAAIESLHAQGVMDQPIISLAKRLEEVFCPGQSRPILLPRDSMALFLLQQIRDEAHRFAITYHRTLRQKAATHSALDDIPGIGPQRKKLLLSHFGSLEKIAQASPSDLATALGLKEAAVEKIYEALKAFQQPD